MEKEQKVIVIIFGLLLILAGFVLSYKNSKRGMVSPVPQKDGQQGEELRVIFSSPVPTEIPATPTPTGKVKPTKAPTKTPTKTPTPKAETSVTPTAKPTASPTVTEAPEATVTP